MTTLTNDSKRPTGLAAIMPRFVLLVGFELRKILLQKKAFLFLLALNVVPLLTSTLGVLLWVKVQSLGFTQGLEYSFLVEGMRGILTGHIKLFSLVVPFFLALIVGDVISRELGNGQMKTLLLTPLARAQILAAKALAVMLFLSVVIAFGGVLLQVDIWVAHALKSQSGIVFDLPAETQLLTTTAALRILALTFVMDLVLIAYFTVFALLTDSALLMAVGSLILLMSSAVFCAIAPVVEKLDPRYEAVAKWLFPRYLSEVLSIEAIKGLIEGKVALGDAQMLNPLLATGAWTVGLGLLALGVFHRREIHN